MSKGLYMRQHSDVVRKWQNVKDLSMKENSIINLEGAAKIIIVLICRNKQRMLQHAWQILSKNTNVTHDYESDLSKILTRKLPDNSLRTELEIEVLYKWVVQTKQSDPTGISNTLYHCKKRCSVYSALQQLRLEFYEANETVLFQGDLPRSEDGHFTILNGECEIVQFENDSVPSLKLLYLAKHKKWDEAKKHLESAQVLVKLGKLSGFGELSSLTNAKRTASVRVSSSSLSSKSITEILVLPRDPFLDCLKNSKKHSLEQDNNYNSNNAQSVSNNENMDLSKESGLGETIDFMRQSGLANHISSKDLFQAANSLVRKTLYCGDILYCKGETVKSMFLVVSGEFVLDTGNVLFENNAVLPFSHTNVENCYHLSTGSILGFIIIIIIIYYLLLLLLL
jgi:CRP-like cAMP-binding protein